MSIARGGRVVFFFRFLKIAFLAFCTVSALTLNSHHTGMFSRRVSISVRRSAVNCRGLVCSIKMIATGETQQPSNGRNILALDFDGVVCASSVESSFSSIVAAEKFWPTICKIMVPTSQVSTSYSPIATEEENSSFCRIRSAVNELRPIVETGFENMLLVRALYEELQSTGNIDAASLMKRWTPDFRDQLLSKYDTNKEELVAFFGKIRDDLIAESLDSWVELNQVYPCVADCLSNIAPKRLDFTIITTKQERFVTAILEKNQITPPEKENIYDLENPFGAKTKVLAALLEKYNSTYFTPVQNKETDAVTIHFVEDRFETLLAVTKIPALDSVQLYLVDWGYNTHSQREEAKKMSPRIKLINGDEFRELATAFIR